MLKLSPCGLCLWKKNREKAHPGARPQLGCNREVRGYDMSDFCISAYGLAICHH